MNYKNLYKLTRNFIISVDSKGIILELTPIHSKPLDYTPKELIGSCFFNYIIPTSSVQIKKQFKNLKNNKAEKTDYKFITKKNKPEWYKLSFIKDKSGIVIYCNEIDALKLNENNRIFKSMADNAPIPIVGINYHDLSLNYSNKRFIKDIGFDYSEIRKFKEWHKKIIFIDDDDKKRKGIERQKYIEKMVQGAFVNGVVLRRNIITKSGEVKKFEIDFSVLDKTNLYVFFYDITDKHFAQKLMKENEAKVRMLLENLPVPILCFDLTNNNILVNNKQKEIISQIISKIKTPKDFSKFIITNSSYPNSIKIFLDSLKKVNSNKPESIINIPDYEINLKCADKKERVFKIKSTIIEATLVMIFKDVTEERKALILLEESEKNFRALAENMPTAIGAYDSKEKIIFLNTHFTLLTGYTKDDIPTLKEWYKQSQPDPKSRREDYLFWKNLLADYKNITTTVKPIIMRKVRCKNGTLKDLNFLFSIAKETFYVQVIDVTEERNAKMELEKSHNQLRSLTGSLQNEIEKERKYISREIHDELGQQITGLKMQVSNIYKKNNNENIKEEYQEILNSIDHSIKTVRNISTKLRPSILDDLGLNAAIEWHLKEISKTSSIKFVFKNNFEENELTKEIQLQFFRILQESITNIIRHANATKVEINLYKDKQQICFSIKDNGKGFDLDAPTNSLGILLMRERVLTINGELKIESFINKGTTIKVWLPEKN